jgi:hypothetical protein
MVLWQGYQQIPTTKSFGDVFILSCFLDFFALFLSVLKTLGHQRFDFWSKKGPRQVFNFKKLPNVSGGYRKTRLA